MYYTFIKYAHTSITELFCTAASVREIQEHDPSKTQKKILLRESILIQYILQFLQSILMCIIRGCRVGRKY